MVLGEVCGFFIRSNRVETDSTLGAAQVQRIGIELQKGHQGERQRAGEAAAMRTTFRRCLVMKSSSRAKRGKAHILGFAWRIEQHDHGWQHGD